MINSFQKLLSVKSPWWLKMIKNVPNPYLQQVTTADSDVTCAWGMLLKSAR